MTASRRRNLVAALVTGVALVGAAGAAADHGGRDGDDEGGGLRAGLIANRAADPAIHGVAAAPADWRLRSGGVRLGRTTSRGLSIRLEVNGLVLASTGRTGSVTTITASVFCAGTRAGETAAARLSARGNAELRGSVAAPARCLAPEVVVHPNGNNGLFIAASGM